MKRAVLLLLSLGWLFAVVALATDGPLTNIGNLKGRTDENGYLKISGGTPGVVDGPLTNIANLKGRTDENGYLRVAMSGGTGLFGDGTAPLPSIAFASEPTLGFRRSSAGSVTLEGNFAVNGSQSIAAGGSYSWLGRALFTSPGDGRINVANNANGIGSQLKVDALPVATACGAGSPAVVAGSTPLSGSVTVGTGGPLTCTITYGGTAYPSAPHCSGAVETTTAANARAMGYSSSTTVLTIVPATAWADSSVVNWTCISSK